MEYWMVYHGTYFWKAETGFTTNLQKLMAVGIELKVPALVYAQFKIKWDSRRDIVILPVFIS